jgi:hypothetical protein
MDVAVAVAVWLLVPVGGTGVRVELLDKRLVAVAGTGVVVPAGGAGVLVAVGVLVGGTGVLETVAV